MLSQPVSLSKRHRFPTESRFGGQSRPLELLLDLSQTPLSTGSVPAALGEPSSDSDEKTKPVLEILQLRTRDQPIPIKLGVYSETSQSSCKSPRLPP